MSDEETSEDKRQASRRSEKMRSRLSVGHEESQTEQTSQIQQEEQKEQAPQEQQESQITQEPKEAQVQQKQQTPVTERKHATFYLGENLLRELDRGGEQASWKFEDEYGVELEKNRHIRPLVIQLGLQQLQDMNAKDINNVLEESDNIDDASQSD